MGVGYFFILLAINSLFLLAVFFYFKNKIEFFTDSKRILSDIRDEVDRIIVDLNHTTAQNIELIEVKIKELKKESERAEKLVGILHREKTSKDSGRKTYTEILKKSREVEAHREVSKEKDLNKIVLELYNSGISESMIAKEVGLSIGEVQLILSLNGRR